MGTNHIPRRTPCATDTTTPDEDITSQMQVRSCYPSIHQAPFTITTQYQRTIYMLHMVYRTDPSPRECRLTRNWVTLLEGMIITTLQPTTYHWTPGSRHPCHHTDPCQSLDRISSDMYTYTVKMLEISTS